MFLCKKLKQIGFYIKKVFSKGNKESSEGSLEKSLEKKKQYILNKYPAMSRNYYYEKKSGQTEIFSLPEEILWQVLAHLNQVDAAKMRLVNKQFYILGTVKLFNKFYVYLPEHSRVSDIEKPATKSTYGHFAFQTNYSVINSIEEFNKIIGTKELSMVKHFFLEIHSPNSNSDYCYNYLIEKCPWITVDVTSSDSNMFQKQFVRLDKATYLQVQNNFRFMPKIKDNFSIKKLYINGCTVSVSDPLALIPHMKALTMLHVCDYHVKDILKLFKDKNLTNLKLNHLGLEVPQLSIQKLNKVFKLNEINTLELRFIDNVVTPYEDLKWLSSQMTKLRNISLTFCNTSFERIMQQFEGHTLHKIIMQSYGGEQQKFTESQYVELLKGHEHSVTLLGLANGTNTYTSMRTSHMTIKKDYPYKTKSFQTYLPKDKYPNLTAIYNNESVHYV